MLVRGHAAMAPGAVWLLLQRRRLHGLDGAVALGLGLLRGAGRLHVDVGDAGRLGVLRQDAVDLRVGVFGDDVPAVEEARQEAEHAEEDVDEGVGGAEAGFYPDWRR